MLPSLARTRPSSGVPTNRFRSEPTPPGLRQPGEEGLRRGDAARMKRRIWVKASGLTRFPLERPGAVLSANSVESTRTESIRKRRSTASPSSHEPAAAELPAELLEQHLGEPVLAAC